MMVHRFALKGEDEMLNALAFESELGGVLTGTILTSKWGKDKSCSHKHISSLKSGEKMKDVLTRTMMQKTRIATTTKSPLSKLAITLSYKYKYDTKTNSNEIVTTIKNLRSKLAITPSFIAVQNCHTNKNQSRLCVCD